MGLPTLRNLRWQGKKVLVRVDFNVPIDEEGAITDLTRIKETIPTLTYLLEEGAALIIMSHFGRPKGKKDPKWSLKLCQQPLSSLLGRSVRFVEDYTTLKSSMIKEGEVYLLENLRFYPAEERPELDPAFGTSLAALGDAYVNDAFGSCHRAHTSITVLPAFFPHARAAGFLLEKELSFLGQLGKQRPFHAIIGGAKVSSKLGVLEAFLPKADALYLGGGMAFTFLKAQGYQIGDSLYEEALVEKAAAILQIAKERGIPIYLPIDALVAISPTKEAKTRLVQLKDGIKEGEKGLDVGPSTLSSWEVSLKQAQSIFWNGPLGLFELAPFAKGTFQLARFLASLSSFRIVGGGDSLAAIEQLQLNSSFTHLSTGGGASLEFLEKGSLLGVTALQS